MRPYRRFLSNATRSLLGGGLTKTRNFKTESAVSKTNELPTGSLGKAFAQSKSESSLAGQKKGKKESPARPNYFVAIPIKNAQIKEKLQQVQKAISDSNKKLQSTLVSLDKTHITLMVMHLKDEEQIECATKALEAALSKLKSEGIRNMALDFEGLGHFRNQVVFARISENDGLVKLRQIADIVRTTFTDHGLATTDDRAFQAHMTVAKLSKDPKLRFRGVKKIDGTIYQEFESAVFGKEICSKLQLLSMMKTDKVTGYYHCVSELAFSEDTVIEVIAGEAGSEVPVV